MADLFDVVVARKLSGGGGGGGSSDFSTAVLHAVDMNGDDVMGDYNPPIFQGPFIGTIPVNGGIECSFFSDIFGDGTLILYKGRAFVGLANVEWPVSSISGNIEDIGDGGYLVTGDCTIVFDTE